MFKEPLMKTVRWSELVHFTEKQKIAELYAEKNKYVLFGGAMGGGKSFWLRWMLVKFLLRWAKEYKQKGIRAGLFCEDYPALKDRHIAKIQYEFPAWLGILNKVDHEFVLYPQYGSGVIAFRNLDDPSKYASSEFAIEAVDELTKNQKDVFNHLRTRLRWPGIEETKFLAGTNPGSIGHAWVKKMWLDRQFESMEKEADDFIYVPATAYDNPYLTPRYFDQLVGLPEKLRKAFLEGNWDVFEGQVFSEWDPVVHVFSDEIEIAKEWRKFICIDYGYVAPSAAYWCAVTPDDHVIIFDELYQTGLRPEMLAAEIVEKSSSRMDYAVGDPSMWSKTGHTGRSIAETMEDYWRTEKWQLPFRPGDNDRIHGLQQVREFLAKAPDGKPWLQVSSKCKNLIRTLSMLVYDETKKEDVDTDGEDHAYDAIRYGLMSRPKRPKSYVGFGKSEERVLFDARKSFIIRDGGVSAKDINPIFEKEESSIMTE